MNHSKYNTLTSTLNDLKIRGYKSSFQLKGKKMTCLETGKAYAPEDMCIAEYYRFEGASNPSDMSILYAIECEDGNKGTIISSFGIYADTQKATFIDSVKMKEDKSLTSTDIDSK